MLVPTVKPCDSGFALVKVIGSPFKGRDLLTVLTAVDNVDNSVEACRP